VSIAVLLLAAVAALLVGDLVIRRTLLQRLESGERQRADEVRAQAAVAAEAHRKGAELAAQERADALEAAALERDAARRAELAELDAALAERRRETERLASQARQERAEVERREAGLARRVEQLTASESAAASREAEASRALEELAGLSRDEARARLFEEMTAAARRDAAADVRRIVEQAREGLDERLRELTARALQRVTTGGFAESTLSVIRLPSDDLKGRIIGREGRNIRSIEMTAGIDLIVDDTPGTISISCFDPLRREVARLSIERLVEDGRIHPARIEEIVEKTRQDMEQIVQESGESTCYELGVQDVNPRLVRLLGRLKYHSHLGQNVLQHCRETADLAAILAHELGVPADVPRRAALLHEIAQAAEERPAGASIPASAEMAGRHGESEAVQHAIAAAHPEVTPRDLAAAIVRLACRLSRARPGARRQNLEVYVTRLRRLEEAARAFAGVQEAWVFRAGKELRVLVEPTRLSDAEAVLLSRDIAARIEREVEHTGPVRVSVLRETRAVDYAL